MSYIHEKYGNTNLKVLDTKYSLRIGLGYEIFKKPS